MAIKTLKVETSVTIVDSGAQGVIRNIEGGKYQLRGSRLWYSAGDLRAVKTIPEKKKSVQVKKVNDLRVLLNKIYKILAAELKPLNTVCEANLPGCTKRATQIHHKAGRRNFLLILSKYFGYQCDSCHKFCTKHSKEAKEMGLSMPINSKVDYDFTDREKELMAQFGVKQPK